MPLPPVAFKPDGQTIAELGRLLEKLGITGLVSTVLGVPTDWVAHWHSGNLLRWYDAYAELRAQRKLEGKPVIPPSLLMPALRAIADEDDDDMLRLWAGLIAGFDELPASGGSRKVFVRLLSEMEPTDIGLLIFLLSGEAHLPISFVDA